MPTFSRTLPDAPPGAPAVELHYELSGPPWAPPLVLLSGWTLNLYLWDGQAAALSRRFRLLRYDPRNTGRSTSAPQLDSSRMADAEDLAALMDHLGVARAHFVGHSKGARNLAHFAHFWPDRVLSATFVGTAEPHPPQGRPEDYRESAHAGVENIRQIALTEGVEAALAKLRRGKLIGKLHATPEGMHTFHRATEGYRCADLLGEPPQRHVDLASLPGRLKVPVHVLSGEDDPFLGECRYAADRYADSLLTILPRCGHLPMLESPRTFLGALQAFYTGRCGIPLPPPEPSITRDYAALTADAAGLASAGDTEERMRRLTDLLWERLGPTGVSWCGFYVPAEEGTEMRLAACRPKPACSPIGLHGACGQSFLSARPLVVHDVRELGPNYVACDPRDQSEVVVPVVGPGGACLGVLDLDSHEVGAFTETDAEGLAAVLRAAGLTRG